MTEKIGIVSDVSGAGEGCADRELPERRRGRRRNLGEARANLRGRRKAEGGARRKVGGQGLFRLQDCGKYNKSRSIQLLGQCGKSDGRDHFRWPFCGRATRTADWESPSRALSTWKRGRRCARTITFAQSSPGGRSGRRERCNLATSCCRSVTALKFAIELSEEIVSFLPNCLHSPNSSTLQKLPVFTMVRDFEPVP